MRVNAWKGTIDYFRRDLPNNGPSLARNAVDRAEQRLKRIGALPGGRDAPTVPDEPSTWESHDRALVASRADRILAQNPQLGVFVRRTGQFPSVKGLLDEQAQSRSSSPVRTRESAAQQQPGLSLASRMTSAVAGVVTYIAGGPNRPAPRQAARPGLSNDPGTGFSRATPQMAAWLTSLPSAPPTPEERAGRRTPFTWSPTNSSAPSRGTSKGRAT